MSVFFPNRVGIRGSCQPVLHKSASTEAEFQCVQTTRTFSLAGRLLARPTCTEPSLGSNSTLHELDVVRDTSKMIKVKGW